MGVYGGQHRPMHFAFVALSASVAFETQAMACVCIPDKAALEAAAAAADIVVEAEVVAITAAAPEGDKSDKLCGSQDPDWRVLRTQRIIRGVSRIPSVALKSKNLTVRISRLAGEGSCNALTTCDNRPAVGEKGIWAIKMVAGVMTLSNVCITAAAREVAERNGTH